jgi:hypothetical protein
MLYISSLVKGLVTAQAEYSASIGIGSGREQVRRDLIDHEARTCLGLICCNVY